MDKIVAESARLTPELLIQDEEAYDKLATSIVSRLSPGIPQAALKSTLDVSGTLREIDSH